MWYPARFRILICTSLGVSAALAFWTHVHARTPFDYMVVGTVGTTVGLAVAFVAVALKKRP